MKLSRIAVHLLAITALCLCACASPPGLDSAPRARAAVAPLSAVSANPSPSAVEVAPQLAPSPFRLVGDLALDLHVLSDGRVIGERLREATDAEAVRESLGVGGFARDSFLLGQHGFEHVNRYWGIRAGLPAVSFLVGTPDGAIDAIMELSAEQILLVVNPVTGPARGQKPPLYDYYRRWAGYRVWGGTTLGLMVNPGSLIVSVRGPERKLERAPDPSCWNKLRVDATELWSTDEELFAFGKDCDGKAQLVEIWRLGEPQSRVVPCSAGAPPAELPVPLAPGGEPGRVWRGDDGKVYVAGESPQVYVDGRFIPTPTVSSPPAFRARDGRLYRAKGRAMNSRETGHWVSWGFCPMEDSLCWGHWAPRLFEVVGGVEREVALPAPEPLLHVFDGTLWIHTSDGKLYKLDDGGPFVPFEIKGG